uniref:Uncharacterized protein n=1 Tax=Cacopsylla melanoneura TaxID=428564 RepID=A0A8D8MGR1_9HEMI
MLLHQLYIPLTRFSWHHFARHRLSWLSPSGHNFPRELFSRLASSGQSFPRVLLPGRVLTVLLIVQGIVFLVLFEEKAFARRIVLSGTVVLDLILFNVHQITCFIGWYIDQHQINIVHTLSQHFIVYTVAI